MFKKISGFLKQVNLQILVCDMLALLFATTGYYGLGPAIPVSYRTVHVFFTGCYRTGRVEDHEQGKAHCIVVNFPAILLAARIAGSAGMATVDAHSRAWLYSRETWRPLAFETQHRRKFVLTGQHLGSWHWEAL